MLSFRAKGADVTRRLVDEPMANHFVFTLKTLTTFGSTAVFDWTIMWPVLRVNVGMRA